LKNKEILDSWKEISTYLERDVRTCCRWEKELGLPVHRIDDKSPRSKVFAYTSEIDDWLKEKAKGKIKKKSFLENRWAIIGLISGIILISIIFAYLYHNKTFSSPSENLTIAVLPFENFNSSKHDEYFSEGITNEIIQNLLRRNEVKVIPPPSVFKYKDSTMNVEQIGEELGVEYILKGYLEKVDDKIKVNVQLIRTKDRKKIWNEEFNETLKNIISIQNNICLKVSEILNGTNIQKPSTQPPDKRAYDFGAYDVYLKGNYILSRLNQANSNPWQLYFQGKYYWGKNTKDSNELAIHLFSQAIKIDNSFALAYIGLAHCYANYVNFNWDFNIKWVDKAEELVKKAQTIEPELPEYYSTLIEIYLLKEVNFNQNTENLAFTLAQEGIKKYPNHPQLNSIVGYCYYLKFGEQGNEADFEKALEYKERNFWINPHSLGNIVYAELLMLKKEFYEAMHVCNIVKKNDSSLLANFRLAEIYYYWGDLDKSKAIFQQFENSFEEKICALFYLGMIASRKGDIEEAQRIIQEINTISPEFLDYHLGLASIHMGLGEKELGYRYLKSFFNQALAKRERYLNHKYIELDKNFEEFKNKEEFKKIINS